MENLIVNVLLEAQETSAAAALRLQRHMHRIWSTGSRDRGPNPPSKTEQAAGVGSLQFPSVNPSDAYKSLDEMLHLCLIWRRGRTALTGAVELLRALQRPL